MKKAVTLFVISALCLVGCAKTEEPRINENTGKKQLVVAIDLSASPYGYEFNTANEDAYAHGTSGYASGYDVWFAKELAKSMNKELVIRNKYPNTFERALSNDEVDLAMGGCIARSEDGLLYSNVYYPSTLQMVVLKDSKASTFTDLKQCKGMKLSAVESTYAEDLAKSFKHVKKVKSEVSYKELLQSLKDKETDAILVDSNIASLMVAQNEDVQVIAFDENKGLPPSKGVSVCCDDEELLDKINGFIKKQKGDKVEETMKSAIEKAPNLTK